MALGRNKTGDLPGVVENLTGSSNKLFLWASRFNVSILVFKSSRFPVNLADLNTTFVSERSFNIQTLNSAIIQR